MTPQNGHEGVVKAPFLSDEAIEAAVERELVRAGLMPDAEACATDVEALLERHLGAMLDVGAELPDDVLGVTELCAGMPPTVLVNRSLTDAIPMSGPGRWRATLAHEAGHIILHRALIEPAPGQQLLFEAGDVSRVYRCLFRDKQGGFDPLEVQANRGMAALLMPRRLFAAVARERRAAGISDLRLSNAMAQRFAVSRQAAEIQLERLGFLPTGGTITGLW